MGHTENKILLAEVWQKPNTYQLNCGSQTLVWQSVARNQTCPIIVALWYAHSLAVLHKEKNSALFPAI
jgi:hypothetical protein